MIEIRCPRCGQYWYDNDEKQGRARLCSRCADHLRLKRERRGLIDPPFLIVAGMLLWTDLSLIALSALLPALFAKVMLVCGGLQLAGGMIGLSWLGFNKEEGRAAYLSSFTYDTDWKIGRWLLLMALSGLLCLLAAGAFLGFKSKSQKSRSEIRFLYSLTCATGSDHYDPADAIRPSIGLDACAYNLRGMRPAR